MFFKENDSILLLFAIQNSSESCQLLFEVPHPDKFKKKGIIALKLCEDGLTQSNIGRVVVFLELTSKVYI